MFQEEKGREPLEKPDTNLNGAFKIALENVPLRKEGGG